MEIEQIHTEQEIAPGGNGGIQPTSVKIAKQTHTEQVVVAWETPRDDPKTPPYMNTYSVPGTLPAEGTKARTAWDAERAKEIAAQYADFLAQLAKPVPEETAETLQAELDRVTQDHEQAEAKMATLTAKVAAAVSVRDGKVSGELGGIKRG